MDTPFFRGKTAKLLKEMESFPKCRTAAKTTCLRSLILLAMHCNAPISTYPLVI